MLGTEIRFGHGLVSPRRVERPAAPPTRPRGLGNELLGVQWVLVRRRVHALCVQGCGGGAPSQFWNFHGEGGFLRPWKKILCLLGKCVSVRTKMENAGNVRFSGNLNSEGIEFFIFPS